MANYAKPVNFAALGNLNSGALNGMPTVGRPAGPPSDFASGVGAARDEVNNLVSHIAEVADRLVGATPTPNQADALHGQAGIFGGISGCADNILTRASDGHEYLRRIEAALPPL